jgi:ACT domain-containing protein
LHEPPPRGSLQDIVLQALLIRKDQIEYAKTRAIVQAIYDKENAQTALDQYRDAQFPYYQKLNRQEKDDRIKQLKEWIGQGSMTIRPLWAKKAKSRLKTKALSRDPADRAEATRRVSRKMKGYG